MNHRIIFIVAAGLFFCFCNEERPKENNYQAKSVSTVTDSARSVNYDSLLTVLGNLQDSIRSKPGDKAIVERYLQASYDTTSGIFRVVGKGVGNPRHPEAARAVGQKLAASYDGKRWSLFCKAWFTGSTIIFGTSIKGDIAYSNTLFAKSDGDTLYVLLEVPVGSIEVK